VRRPRLKTKFWVCNWSISTPCYFGTMRVQRQSGRFPTLGATEEEARKDAECRIRHLRLGLDVGETSEVDYAMRPATVFERLYIG